MGQMRFRLHSRDRIIPDGLERIYVAGPEEVPWSTTARWDGSELVVQRQVSDSGEVYVPWIIDGHGLHLLGTTTLVERERPYLLEIELARGLVHRIRNRLFLWESLGLETPEVLGRQLAEATRDFARGATMQQETAAASEAANRAISRAMSVADELIACYAQQLIAARQQQAPISTLLGVTLGSSTPPLKVRRQLLDACNIIQLPIAWRAIESREGHRDWKQTDEQLGWCQTAGLKVAAGPLLQIDDRGAPDWMYLWEGEFDNLARLMLDHVRTVVKRYAGRVHLWHVASRVNNGALLSFDEEQRLQLVAQALQLTRKIDPRTPIVVSFDQPWGEYLAKQDQDLAPLHYADALLRADLGISGFGLEINAGYLPNGSPHRPVIEYGRLFDQWSAMGLPLMVMLTTASRADADPEAATAIRVEPFGGSGATAAAETVDAVQRSICPQEQWAKSVISMLLARPTVQVVMWNQLSDKGPHELPHAGLFDGSEQPKPMLQILRDLRKSCLS